MTVLALSALPLGSASELASRVPADVGVYIELQRGEDLLLELLQPQLWLTVAELAGQPAAPQETAGWRRRVEQTVGMTPEETIRQLFAERVAFVMDELHSAQDSVIVCRPRIRPGDLMQRWAAQPLPTSGRVAVYRLRYGIGLAVDGDYLILGDAVGRGLFERVVRQAETRKPASLAEDPAFLDLLARTAPNPDGLIFLRRPQQPATASAASPAGASPPATVPAARPRPRRDEGSLLEQVWPWSGGAHLLLVLHREGSSLHISLVHDQPPRSSDTQPGFPGTLSRDLVERLPQETLFAWSGRFDAAQLSAMAQALPENSIARTTYQLLQRPGRLGELITALEPVACVAIGATAPTTRPATTPPVPAVAFLLPAREPAAVESGWRELFHNSVALYRLLSLRIPNPPRIRAIEPVEVGDLPAERLDLRPLLGPAPQWQMLGDVGVFWAIDGDVMIVASHAAWLARIVDARQGRAAALGSTCGTRRDGAIEAGSQSVVWANTAGVADLGRAWLEYLRNTAPAVLDENWWRTRQPGGAVPRIGVQVTQDGAARRLRVYEVTPGLPASSVLRPGDQIVGCNGRRFATSQPVDEMRRALIERPNARWLDLLVERDRLVRVKRVAMPFVDPIEVLRRVVSVGDLLGRVVYCENGAGSATAQAHVTLELRGSATATGGPGAAGGGAAPQAADKITR